MGVPPRGIQPKNRLPKEENERIIEETIRRIKLQFPGLVGAALPGIIGGGGGAQPLIADDGTIIVDDDGHIIYVG